MKKIFSLFLILFFNLIAILAVTAQDPAVYTLDIDSNAVAAYGMRRLSSTYTGSLFLLRRDSDDALLDIDFMSNGLPDTTQIRDFLGNSRGFITTAYDQSGNLNHAKQTSNVAQPELLIDNALYTMHFDGTNDSLVIDPGPISLNDMQGFVHIIPDGTTANESIIILGQNQRYRIAIDQSGFVLFGMLNPISAIYTPVSIPLFTPVLIDFSRIASTGEIFLDNLFEIQAPLPNNTFEFTSIGSSFNGEINELIIYGQATPQRATIAENIIDFWNNATLDNNILINPTTGNEVSFLREISSGDTIIIFFLAALVFINLMDFVRGTYK